MKFCTWKGLDFSLDQPDFCENYVIPLPLKMFRQLETRCQGGLIKGVEKKIPNKSKFYNNKNVPRGSFYDKKLMKTFPEILNNIQDWKVQKYILNLSISSIEIFWVQFFYLWNLSLQIEENVNITQYLNEAFWMIFFTVGDFWNIFVKHPLTSIRAYKLSRSPVRKHWDQK